MCDTVLIVNFLFILGIKFRHMQGKKYPENLFWKTSRNFRNIAFQKFTVTFEPGLWLSLILLSKYGVLEINTIPVCIFYRNPKMLH